MCAVPVTAWCVVCEHGTGGTLLCDAGIIEFRQYIIQLSMVLQEYYTCITSMLLMYGMA